MIPLSYRFFIQLVCEKAFMFLNRHSSCCCDQLVHVPIYLECFLTCPTGIFVAIPVSCSKRPPFLVRLPLISEDTFNTPVAVPRPLMFLTKRAARSSWRFSEAPILVFGLELVNTHYNYPPSASLLLASTMKAKISDGDKPLPPSNYDLIHLGLM